VGKHLAPEDVHKLQILRAFGFSQYEIALALNVTASAISKKLKELKTKFVEGKGPAYFPNPLEVMDFLRDYKRILNQIERRMEKK